MGQSDKEVIPPHLQAALDRLSEDHLRRSLKPAVDLGLDFSSNDYLGLGRMEFPSVLEGIPPGGAGGSRLLTGHHPIHAKVETFCADYFQAPATLLFNSGYHANLGLLSSIADRHTTFLYDEQVHASIKDGIRLSPAKAWPFPHQDMEKLEGLLKKANGIVYIVVEALYSMDGDLTDIQSVCDLADRHGAWVILDEAHSTGLYGSEGAGLAVSEKVADRILARIYTFGKAAAWVGAVVAGASPLREYLLNKARSFVYTTAAPPQQVAMLLARLERMRSADVERKQLFEQSEALRKALGQPYQGLAQSPIVSFLVPGNEAVRGVANVLQAEGFDVRPILAPTVKTGTERLRIIVHSFNHSQEITRLAALLTEG